MKKGSKKEVGSGDTEEVVVQGSLNLNIKSSNTQSQFNIVNDVTEPSNDVTGPSNDVTGPSNDVTGPSNDVTESRSNEPLKDDVPLAVKLPETVTVLVNGDCTIYLVGTAHFSVQSQEDVAITIQTTRPNLVLLELCQSRRNILTLDEATILKEAQDLSWGKIRSSLTGSNSSIQGLLHLVLLSMSAQLTKQLGMAPGGEFRSAVKEARKLPNCMVVLGDRPFQVTIARALASLTFVQKAKLAWQFLSSSDDITKEEIERCKERDLLEKMLSEMTGEFPSITEVFVNERDVFLAHSLYLASEQPDVKVIVGVVGMGHVRGITSLFGKTDDKMIAEISKSPPPGSQAWRLLRATLKYGTYFLIGYTAFKFASKQSGWVKIAAEKFNFK